MHNHVHCTCILLYEIHVEAYVIQMWGMEYHNRNWPKFETTLLTHIMNSSLISIYRPIVPHYINSGIHHYLPCNS